MLRKDDGMFRLQCHTIVSAFSSGVRSRMSPRFLGLFTVFAYFNNNHKRGGLIMNPVADEGRRFEVASGIFDSSVSDAEVAGRVQRIVQGCFPQVRVETKPYFYVYGLGEVPSRIVTVFLTRKEILALRAANVSSRGFTPLDSSRILHAVLGSNEEVDRAALGQAAQRGYKVFIAASLSSKDFHVRCTPPDFVH
jgi:hypothetical protein